MAKEALVESLIADSIRLVEELDRQGDGPSKVRRCGSSFRMRMSGRFLLAGPVFDRLLPKEESRAYQEVSRAIGTAMLESLTIAEVELVRTDHAVLLATQIALETPADVVVRAHFRDNTFDGVFVEEMLVLRAA